MKTINNEIVRLDSLICHALGMKPDKTSVKVSNTMSSIDKANDDKDQTKNSMTVSVTQDFKWGDK